MLPGGRFGALQERPFRLLWLARTASAIGDRMVPVALAFAVIDLTGSATDLGIVLAAGVVPNAALVIVGGIAGDRFDRTRVMLSSDGARALSQGTIAVLLLTGEARVWHLVATSAAWGAAAAFFAPASTGVVPATVSTERLQQANALLSLTRNIVGLGAPALSGALVAAFGAGVVFALDALTFVVSALFLLALKLPPRAMSSRASLVRELIDGWRELTSRGWLWSSVLGFGFWNVALAFFFVLGPVVFAKEVGGAAAWGLVMTGAGVGSLIGGMLALRYRPRRPAVAVWALTLASPLQLLLLVPPAPAFVNAAAAVAAMVGISISMNIWTTALQEHVPDEALSRVSAYDWLVSIIAMPVGYAVAGPAADAFGVDATLLTAAGVMLGATLVCMSLPSVRALRRPEPAAQPAEPALEPAI